jgi:flagellar basal-body rod modification protein FlgD
MTISSLTQQNNPSTATVENKNGTIGDYQTFLKLFTVQLQNQDPTQPLDTNQMTQQLAQFSTVEQAVKQNDNLTTLINQQKQNQLSTAVSLIGAEVETSGSSGDLIGGQATFSYVLPKEADNVQVTLTDSAGRAVFQGQGTKAKGRNLVVWDGVNSFNGQAEPSGTYSITVKAKDAASNEISVDSRAVGVVRGVETASNGTVQISIGDRTVNYDEILAVRTPTQVSTSNGQNGGNS